MDPEEANKAERCKIKMAHGTTCGREIFAASTNWDPVPVCLMHSRDMAKEGLFFKELESILAQSSSIFDFTGFVFPYWECFGQTFDREASFSGVVFTQDASFKKAVFEDKTDFRYATFESHAHFQEAKFKKVALFEGSSFKRNCYFQDGFFRNADFYNARFDEDVNANFTHFSHLNMSSAVFKGFFDLRMTIIEESARFEKATFEKGAAFDNAELPGAIFDGSIFHSDAFFRSTKFIGETSFRGVNFAERAVFVRSCFESVGQDSPYITDFEFASFERPHRVQFHQVNKESSQPWRVRLVNCNVEDVRFEDNNWYSQGSRGLVLQDELDLLAKGDEDELDENNYELVALAYRRLISNFDRAKAYDLAEDCYVGTMEMRRLNPDTSKFARVVSRIYRMASYYGSSYQRAAVALAVLIVVFTGMFLLAGFSNADGRVVEYNLLPNAGHGIPSRSQAISDYADAFILTLLTMTFRSSQYFRPLGFWSQLVVVVSTIVLTSQLALFILALRRRFRR